ncbi:MAG: ribonuclease E activity regulator RraA [Planifilum sp.]|jgi:regulator of ribonuclease activity A
MDFKTTDLCDQFSSQAAACEDLFTSFGGKKRFSGPIATVRVFEDNVLVRKMIETIPAGTVLVVDGGGSKRCALLGDRLAAIALERGIAGFIIHGCVRDTAELARMDIGVLALGKVPLRSRKEGKGVIGEPVRFAGVDWIPGHHVYVDEDGVVLFPQKMTP